MEKVLHVEGMVCMDCEKLNAYILREPMLPWRMSAIFLFALLAGGII